MLVFHASAHGGEEMIHCLDKLKLSAHYIIDETGDVLKLVDDKYRAYHAGVSYWRGIEDVNSHSIGIEVSSLSLGQKKYKKAQIETLISFSKELTARYDIPAVNIVGHSDIAPLRKPDPGVAFPWQKLAENGIGFWYDIDNAVKMGSFSSKELLNIIGYDTRSPEAMGASAYAFCRRFLPALVSKNNDVNELVQNFLPEDYDFMQRPKFIKTLQAVAYSYQQYLSASKKPCKI